LISWSVLEAKEKQQKEEGEKRQNKNQKIIYFIFEQNSSIKNFCKKSDER
jgi:hypothetical protein